MNVEEARTPGGAVRPYSFRIHGLDAAPARMVVLVEERLDGIVQRSERQILVLETGQ
jgi:hypothetical protein